MLQRLLLQLQKYDLTLEFTPSKYLIVADALSSLSNTGMSSSEQDVQVHVNAVRAELPVSEEKWAQMARETEKDDILREVKAKIQMPGQMRLNTPYEHFKGRTVCCEWCSA